MKETKVYVAAPWVHKTQAKEAAAFLESWGYVITSRWLHFHEDTDVPTELTREALNDVEDVIACDVLVLLNLCKSDGKATELGMAYAWKKPIIVVGNRHGNVFYNLPDITVVPSLKEVPRFLARL